MKWHEVWREVELWFTLPILGEKFCFRWIEYLFCFGEMSFCLCKFRNSGKFGHYLVDSVLKIEKVKFVTILSGLGDGGGGRVVLATMVYTGTLRPIKVPLSGFRYMKGYEFDLWSLWKRREICHTSNGWISWFYKVAKTFYFCDWFLLKWHCIYSR